MLLCYHCCCTRQISAPFFPPRRSKRCCCCYRSLRECGSVPRKPTQTNSSNVPIRAKIREISELDRWLDLWRPSVSLSHPSLCLLLLLLPLACPRRAVSPSSYLRRSRSYYQTRGVLEAGTVRTIPGADMFWGIANQSTLSKSITDHEDFRCYLATGSSRRCGLLLVICKRIRYPVRRRTSSGIAGERTIA